MKQQPNHISQQLFRLGVVLAAVLLPLEIVPNRLISIGSALTTLLLLQYAVVKVVTGGRIRLSRRQLLVTAALALPVLSAVISISAAAYPAVAIRATLSLVHLAVRAWLIYLLADKDDVELFKRSVIWVTAAAVVFGYFQYFGDILGLPRAITRLIPQYSSHGTYAFPRVHSLAHEPLYFANFLLLPIGLLVAGLVHKGAGLTKAHYLLLLTALALFETTVARGAIYGLVVSFGIASAALAWRRNLPAVLRLAKVVVASIVVALAMVLGSGIITGHNNLAAFGSHAVQVNDKSFTNRTTIWPLARKAVSEHPLLGVGPGNSREFIDPLDAKRGAPYTALPVFNNSYLTLITEQGLLGLLLSLPLVALLVWMVVAALRRGLQTFAAGYAIAIMALAVQSTTFEAFDLLRTWMLLGFMVAAAKFSERSD